MHEYGRRLAQTTLSEAFHQQTDADGEAAETRVLLHFAFRCGYLEESAFIELDETYDRIMGGLVNMMTHPNKWCGPAHLVREDVAAYNIDR